MAYVKTKTEKFKMQSVEWMKKEKKAHKQLVQNHNIEDLNMTYHLRIYHVVFVTHDAGAAVAVAVAVAAVIALTRNPYSLLYWTT